MPPRTPCYRFNKGDLIRYTKLGELGAELGVREGDCALVTKVEPTGLMRLAWLNGNAAACDRNWNIRWRGWEKIDA